jgi:hypothetical protein
MTNFNTNKNIFNSAVKALSNDFHAFSSLGVPKGSRNSKQQKKALISNVTAAIDSIDTDDFGIRVCVLKSKQ